MSQKHGADTAPPSRRSVVKGAAWAVPAIVVAGAAPTVAASAGPLSFTGGACKLPGNSADIYKGYVFELTAINLVGPLPTNGITVISDVKINGVSVAVFSVQVRSNNACTGGCNTALCGATALNHRFCTPDGQSQQILIYTGPDETGNSQNAEMTVTYQRFDCTTGTCGAAIDPAPITITSGVRSTPPAQGASCNVNNVFPIPTV